MLESRARQTQQQRNEQWKKEQQRNEQRKKRTTKRRQNSSKRDDFDIVNFPFVDGDVPRSRSCGVNISQLIRFARVSC